VVEGNVPAAVLAERALDWLEQAQQFRWFLTLMIADPHHPYEPDPRDVVRLKGTPPPALVESLRRLDSRPGSAERLAIEVGTFYDGEVAGVDRAIETIVRWLAKRDLLRDTLVVVVGAEGEEFYEHNGRLHGQTLFDEVVEVPLVMAGPGLYGPDGGAFVESEPIDLVDATRLLAGFGDLSTQTALQGRLPPPFSPRLPENVSHAVLVPMPPAATADLRASRSRRYLRLFDAERDVESLFDLQADPGATRNLLLGSADKALRLQAETLERSLLEWERACLASSAAQAAPLQTEAP
jgi:arylsulfatase A-like enzyme